MQAIRFGGNGGGVLSGQYIHLLQHADRKEGNNSSLFCSQMNPEAGNGGGQSIDVPNAKPITSLFPEDFTRDEGVPNKGTIVECLWRLIIATGTNPPTRK